MLLSRFLPALLIGMGLLPTQAASADEFADCLARLQPQARAKGVESASYQRYTQDLQADLSVLDLLDAQPEFVTPIWDYLAGLVDEQRVVDGKAMLQQHHDLLERIASRYQVDKYTVVAVWGVESDFGRITGKRPLLTSLSTLSCYGRRQAFFRGEFFATLKLLQQGDLRSPDITGSWAGAFGQTQFMPSTYARIAVDFDGNGHRDLVGSVPDALASTANYLRKAGWIAGADWGYEVKVPAQFPASLAGRGKRKPLSAWKAQGVTRIDGEPLPASSTPGAILLPAGKAGPAFLVMRNYDAIYSYNAAESYALAIALLSDHLRGGSGLHAPWPTDDPGLSRAERKELQKLLLGRGHDIGEPDGMIGDKTCRAIQAEQGRLGLQPADGRAGQKVLRALRGN